MKRKLLAVFLSVCMALSLMPTAVLAAEAGDNAASEITDADSLKKEINAADAGKTVTIPAGTYEIGSLTIEEAVSLQAAEGAAVTIQGQILYKNISSPNSISIKGITFEATDTVFNQAICLSQGIDGVTLNVSDCSIEGYNYGVTANAGAKGTINLSDTMFVDTGCAVSVNSTSSIGTFDNTDIGNGFAVQYFVSGQNGANNFYNTFKSYTDDTKHDTPDVDGASNKLVFNETDLRNAVNAATGDDATEICIAKNITLTSGINVSGKKLNVVGNGHTISFDSSKTQKGVFGNNTNAVTANTEIVVRDLTIKNTGASAEGWASIIGYNAYNAEVSYTDCAFENLGAAVYCNPVTKTVDQSESSAPSIAITACTFEKSGGIGMDYTSSVMIPEITFENNNGITQNLVTLKNADGSEQVFTQIQAAIDNATDGAAITVGPGTYDGNITFGSKSLTIRAQYPAYKNGAKETDQSKLSNFTGTFNTYGENSNSFNKSQKVVIEGFALSGDGLKIGNQNYNSVGNLTVRNCTFACGANLSEVNGNNYAGQNYMIKTNGSADDENYATVVVENNYFSGTPVTNVYPVQLWDVDSATVTGNVMEFSKDYNGQAIGVSKMKENAQVEVSGNSITNAAGGIYITTWELGGKGNNQGTFTGEIEVTDNVMVNVGSESMDAIFIGYDRTAASENAPYGLLAGIQTVSGNTDNGSAVGATIVRGPESSDTKLITAIFQNGDTVYTVTASPAAGETAITVTTPAAPADYGYNHFVGWSDGSKTHEAGAKVIISKDTTFTAVWTYIPPANPNYQIAIGDFANGTVTANPSAAKAGATVTLTATPDEGYALGTLTVTDRFGDAVKVTEQANGTYTFVMPDGQVTVDATFVETEEPAPAEPFTDVDENDWFYDAVVYAYENGLMNGVENNQFAPNTATNRAMLATILYRLAGEPDVSGDMPFTDVAAGQWYTDAVLWAAQNGIVNGLGENTFAPMNTLTREQLVTMLYRYAEAEGYDVSSAADLSGYPDAGKVQTYAQEAMSWAVAEGIVAGMDDGTLNPAGNATRAQIATILMRFCENVAQ